MSDLVVAHNCCMDRMLPGEAGLVSEWAGLPGRKSVKRFERSNGLLNIPLPFYVSILFKWKGFLMYTNSKSRIFCLVVTGKTFINKRLLYFK